MTFERSIDYATIRAIFERPECWRRMTGSEALQQFTVGPRAGYEYILVKEEGNPVAVFLVLENTEVHFVFIPEVWGRTLEIAKGFLDWAWIHIDTPVLIGPIRKGNRLALKLAKRAGFVEYPHDEGDLIFTVLQRPAA